MAEEHPPTFLWIGGIAWTINQVEPLDPRVEDYSDDGRAFTIEVAAEQAESVRQQVSPLIGSWVTGERLLLRDSEGRGWRGLGAAKGFHGTPGDGPHRTTVFCVPVTD